MSENSAEQPDLRAGQVGNRLIDPGNVELVSLHFDRLFGAKAGRDADDGDPDANITFELRTGRAAPDAVFVVLSVNVQAEPVATIKMEARTKLTVTTVDESKPVTTEELAQIAARMGPVVIYPYLRELVADVTRRAGLEPLTLPIYQIGSFFEVDPKSLELPKQAKSTKKSSKKPAKAPGKSTSKKPKAKA